MREIGDESIEAGMITMRPWEPADVAFIYEACQDAEIQRWTPLPSPYRPADAVVMLELSAEGRATNQTALFAITATDTGELLGSIGLKDIDWERRRAEAGYWVAREARGRGVASSALKALVVWAGQHLDLDEVWLQVARGNLASVQVATVAGFEPDGVVPGGCQAGGERVDALVFRTPTR